jgi:purine-binding chemotaxis protein CheW
LADSLRETVLLVRAGARLCGLPVAAVAETMRPLPVAPVNGAPAFVRGVSIVRGEPVPVVDLARLLGGEPEPAPTRFVTVRAGGRRAALAVGAVGGLAHLDPASARTLPLVGDACAGALVSLRALDGDLLLVLGAARLIPEAASLPEAARAVLAREAKP